MLEEKSDGAFTRRRFSETWCFLELFDVERHVAKQGFGCYGVKTVLA